MKNEISPLKSESMSAAAEPVHQGEQQTGDNKRDEDDLDCFEGVLGASLATTDGLLPLAVITPIVIPASYVVSFRGKVRDRGNGIVG
jgi:hypothetical protein